MVPNGWTKIKLGDHFEFRNGVNADKDQYGEGVKFVNVMDVFNNDILTESKIIGRITLSDKQFKDNILHYGDILFNRTSETFDEIAISAVYLDEADATFGGFVIRGRPTTNILDAMYNVYSFQDSDFRRQVIRLGQGAIRANIGQKDLSKVTLLVPPLPEQQKIAKILNAWDKAIDVTERLIDNSKQQKKALMQQLLTGKKRLLNDNGKPFEDEWTNLKVEEIGEIVTGSTPPKNDPTNYGDDISWATADDFKQKYIFNTNVKLSQSGAKKARLVPKGSVLVTCIASIGKNAIADEQLATNQQINSVVVNKQHSNEFFYYLIGFYKHKLVAWAGTTAVPILNKTSFGKLSFNFPPLKEQQKIAAVLTNADKEIELLEQQLADLQQEKKALMQVLLTGKVRVGV